MKHKKLYITIITATVLIAVLIFPFRREYPETGSYEFAALLYRVIVWEQIEHESEIEEKISIYIFPKNFRSFEEYHAERQLQTGATPVAFSTESILTLW